MEESPLPPPRKFQQRVWGNLQIQDQPFLSLIGRMPSYRDFSFDVIIMSASTGTEHNCNVQLLALEVVSDSAVSSVLELSLSELF